MARQSEKRTQKQLKTALPLYLIAAISIPLIKLLAVGLQWFGGRTAKRDTIALAVHTAVNVLAYRSIATAMSCALPFSAYFDLLVTSNLILFLSLFTRKVYYLLYSIPAYALWLLGGRVWAFLGKSYGAEPPRPRARHSR